MVLPATQLHDSPFAWPVDVPKIQPASSTQQVPQVSLHDSEASLPFVPFLSQRVLGFSLTQLHDSSPSSPFSVSKIQLESSSHGGVTASAPAR